MEIAIWELRRGLKKHLVGVRDGRPLTVTDHGRAIARIAPVGELARLEQFRAEGRVTRARRRKAPAPDPVEAAGAVSDLISDRRA